MSQRLAGAAGLSLFLATIYFMLSGASISMAPVGLLLGFWVAFGALAELIDRAKFFRTDLATSFRRLRGLPRTAWSTTLAHLGLGVTVIGIVIVSAGEREVVTTLRPGGVVEIAGYQVALQSISNENGPNFTSDIGYFSISSPSNEIRTVGAERRIYNASGTPTTEAAIETFGFSQVYIQLGEPQAAGSSVVRIWYKPYITLIWMGCVFMAIAGFLSLSYRRYRVGLPTTAMLQAAK